MASFMKWLSIIVFSFVNSFCGEGVFDCTFIISSAIFLAGYLIYEILHFIDSPVFWERLEVLILLTFPIISTVLLVQNTGDFKWIFIMLINIVSGYANAYFSDDYEDSKNNNNNNYATIIFLSSDLDDDNNDDNSDNNDDNDDDNDDK